MTDSFEGLPVPTSNPAVAAAVGQAASLPRRPQTPGSRAAKVESNFATVAAIFAVMLAFFVAMGLFAAVGLGGMAVVFLMVPLGFGLLSLFHYITWGWWMSQLRDEDES